MKQNLLLILFVFITLNLMAIPPIETNSNPKPIQTESITSFDNGNIRLFPNPASDYIRIANGDRIKNVLVINIVGKTVLSFQNIDASEKLDISNLNAGLYLVKLMDENNRNIKTLRLSKR